MRWKFYKKQGNRYMRVRSIVKSHPPPEASKIPPTTTIASLPDAMPVSNKRKPARPIVKGTAVFVKNFETIDLLID